MLKVRSLRQTEVRLRQWLRASEAAFIVLAVVVGLLAGLFTVVQGALAHGLQHLLYGVTINRLSALGSIQHPWRLLALPIGGAMLMLLNRYVFRRAQPPVDVVEANALHGGRIPAADNLVIAAQTIVSNGCGASVGLEATYAQLGGGIASILGQILRLRRADLRTLVGAGAGAAVGAAFNAPLAGAFYAFEIVIGTYSTASVAPVIAATLAGATVLRLLSAQPYLIAASAGRAITLSDYGAYAVLGLLCGVLGIALMRLVTFAERQFHRIRAALWRTVLGGAILMPLAWLSPQTLSAGHGALHLDLLLRPTIGFLLLVLALKILASVIALASGFRGGLFFASLFLGSLAGQAFAQALNLNPWGFGIDPGDAALVGMAALSVSVVGGPMTLAMLMLETTHDFALMGVVLVASLMSGLLTRELFGYSFSTWRMHVRGSDIRSPRDIGWMQVLTADRLMRRDWVELLQEATVGEFRNRVPLGSTSKVILVDQAGHYRGIVSTAAAYAPDLDNLALVGPLATRRHEWLTREDSIKQILAAFDRLAADELAVIANGKPLGIVTERHARRRYLEEIEAAQRAMFGEH